MIINSATYTSAGMSPAAIENARHGRRYFQFWDLVHHVHWGQPSLLIKSNGMLPNMHQIWEKLDRLFEEVERNCPGLVCKDGVLALLNPRLVAQVTVQFHPKSIGEFLNLVSFVYRISMQSQQHSSMSLPYQKELCLSAASQGVFGLVCKLLPALNRARDLNHFLVYATFYHHEPAIVAVKANSLSL